MRAHIYGHEHADMSVSAPWARSRSGASRRRKRQPATRARTAFAANRASIRHSRARSLDFSGCERA